MCDHSSPCCVYLATQNCRISSYLYWKGLILHLNVSNILTWVHVFNSTALIQMNTHFLRHFTQLFKHLFLSQGGIPVTILSPSTKTLNVISGILIEFCNNCDSCGENIPSMKLGLLPLWHCWIWNYNFIGKRNDEKNDMLKDKLIKKITYSMQIHAWLRNPLFAQHSIVTAP